VDTGLLGAMLGATVFGAVLAWWERGPIEPASATRSEARHLMPWVGLRLLAALVAARGFITILTWPNGRFLGLLCVLFALPYLFPWSLARLAIRRRHLAWAEGMGRLGAAQFNGSSHHAGLMARGWAAWAAARPGELQEATERLESHFHGPDTVICRAAMAQLAGRPKEAANLIDSLNDFTEHGVAAPARGWVEAISKRLPTNTEERAAATRVENRIHPSVFAALEDGQHEVDAWLARWSSLSDAVAILEEIRDRLAQLDAPPLEGKRGRDELDWAAQLEGFRLRSREDVELPIALEWASWCALRRRAQAHDGPQGALELRELWEPASHFAVRLWGEPGARLLAAAVLRWLQARARLVADSSRHASASRQLMLAS
jgi:hypothetical protein